MFFDELFVFDKNTNMFWVNLELIEVVQQSFLGGTELSVSGQARGKLLLGVSHLLCHPLWKPPSSPCQKTIRRIEGENMLCKTFKQYNKNVSYEEIVQGSSSGFFNK